MGKPGIAIIGIGEVPTANRPERTHWDIIYDTCLEAIRDAGLHKNDFRRPAHLKRCALLFSTKSDRRGAWSPAGLQPNR